MKIYPESAVVGPHRKSRINLKKHYDGGWFIEFRFEDFCDITLENINLERIFSNIRIIIDRIGDIVMDINGSVLQAYYEKGDVNVVYKAWDKKTFSMILPLHCSVFPLGVTNEIFKQATIIEIEFNTAPVNYLAIDVFA